MNQLASSKLGRITLHTFCLLRHPTHLRWHWKGIVRELVRGSRRSVQRAL